MNSTTPMQQLRNQLKVVANDLASATCNTDQYGYRAAMNRISEDIESRFLLIEADWLKRNQTRVNLSESDTSIIKYNQGYFDGYNQAVAILSSKKP